MFLEFNILITLLISIIIGLITLHSLGVNTPSE